MNSSRANNSSPGFVYFNTDNSYKNSSDTSDFLSFTNNSPQNSPYNSKFSPSNYSSPVKFQRSPRNFGRNNYRGSYSNNSSYNNRSFSNNSFNSVHSSPNLSHSNNFSYNNSWKNDHKQNRQELRGRNNISKFFDESCIKNPWAELEESLKAETSLKINESGANESEESDSSGSSEEDDGTNQNKKEAT